MVEYTINPRDLIPQTRSRKRRLPGMVNRARRNSETVKCEAICQPRVVSHVPRHVHEEGLSLYATRPQKQTPMDKCPHCTLANLVPRAFLGSAVFTTYIPHGILPTAFLFFVSCTNEHVVLS